MHLLALDIYYSKEDRKNNYLNVSVKLKANKTYEGPIQLYALRDGAAENDEILLMECEEVITTTTKWISELYGYSLDYLNLPAGSYILYLKYLHEGEMIKITELTIAHKLTVSLPPSPRRLPPRTIPTASSLVPSHPAKPGHNTQMSRTCDVPLCFASRPRSTLAS